MKSIEVRYLTLEGVLVSNIVLGNTQLSHGVVKNVLSSRPTPCDWICDTGLRISSTWRVHLLGLRPKLELEESSSRPRIGGLSESLFIATVRAHLNVGLHSTEPLHPRISYYILSLGLVWSLLVYYDFLKLWEHLGPDYEAANVEFGSKYKSIVGLTCMPFHSHPQKAS